MKILMVCLGNICRSPLAEGIMQHLIVENNLDWEVDSAGTGSWHVGELPDERSITTAQNHDIDITNQRARQFHFPDFENFDKIYVMDSQNFIDVTKQAANEEEKNKVELIMNELEPGKNINVPDPYWNDNGFEGVYQMLHDSCSMIIKKNI